MEGPLHLPGPLQQRQESIQYNISATVLDGGHLRGGSQAQQKARQGRILQTQAETQPALQIPDIKETIGLRVHRGCPMGEGRDHQKQPLPRQKEYQGTTLDESVRRGGQSTHTGPLRLLRRSSRKNRDGYGEGDPLHS